ncbi:hypothetical protein FOZ60_008444 [Perkinsus olseni]|uniref:DUF4371 domain-containing protein n=2 Tax=Perkinsus olseni TaxID=32597 RepID=A0A7J6PFY5_PEROL|nr:hypothetical protein FOZ60_008444 [Perkinsus olseni]
MQESIDRMFNRALPRRGQPSSSSSRSASVPAPALHPASDLVDECGDCDDEGGKKAIDAGPLEPAIEALQPPPRKEKPRQGWFDKYSWLVDVGNSADGEYQLGCRVCMWANEGKKFLPNHEARIARASLVQGTFHAPLNKVAERLADHAKCGPHQHAVQTQQREQLGKASVAHTISSAAGAAAKRGAVALLNVLLCLQHLLGQGLAIRGHVDEDANFWRLLRLLAKNSPELEQWLARQPITVGGEGPRFLSHRIVEEYVLLLGDSVASVLLERARQARWFSLICDEATDSATRQQIAVCIRFVSPSDLEVRECFISLISTTSSKASALTNHLLEFLEKSHLDVSNTRGLGFDGCSTMSGKHAGVAVRLQQHAEKARYIHCMGHRLNLTLQDGIAAITNREVRAAYEDVLSFCGSFSSFCRDSPQRLASLAIFCEKEGVRSKRLRPLCPTRWVLRVSALEALKDNYEGILDWLASIMEDKAYSSEMRGREAGFLGKFEDFTFFFCLNTLHKFFSEAHPCHKLIQGRSVSLAGAQHACLTLKGTWEAGHTVTKAAAFFDEVTELADELRLEDPKAPRRCRVGGRGRPAASAASVEEQSAASAKRFHIQLYLDLYRCGISSLESRFMNEQFSRVMKLEKLLICKDPGEWKEESLSIVGEVLPGRTSMMISIYRDFAGS